MNDAERIAQLDAAVSQALAAQLKAETELAQLRATLSPQVAAPPPKAIRHDVAEEDRVEGGINVWWECPHCGLDLGDENLTYHEEGYHRWTRLEIHPDGHVTAHPDGWDDYSESSDGERHIECRACSGDVDLSEAGITTAEDWDWV